MLVSQVLAALDGNESMNKTVVVKVIDSDHRVKDLKPCVVQVNHATNELELFVCDTTDT